MRDSLIGRFAVSKAGHDREHVYLIIGEDDKNLYLTDGRFHPPENPKKKNKKHVHIMDKRAGEPIFSRLYSKEKIFDHEVKYAIKTAVGKEEGYVKE